MAIVRQDISYISYIIMQDIVVYIAAIITYKLLLTPYTSHLPSYHIMPSDPPNEDNARFDLHVTLAPDSDGL